MDIMAVLETLGVELVFPTQTLYVRQDPGPGELPAIEEAMKITNPDGLKYPVPASLDDDDASADSDEEG